MQEVNTARVCTRTLVDGFSDPSVPTVAGEQQKRSAQQEGGYNPEKCGASSRQVPWTIFGDASDTFGVPGYRSTHSVGGIPFYVRGQTPNYPPSLAGSKLHLGTRREVEADIAAGLGGFGDLCTHTDLPPACDTDAACATGYRCHSVGKLCVKLNPAAGAGCGGGGGGGLQEEEECHRCYVHLDCAGEKMCSGTGRCVTPVTEVRNEMPDMDAEFRTYTDSCPSSAGGEAEMLSVDMYGASPWGRVPDVLRSHGFCSHRNWFEYNETMTRASSGSSTAGSVCNRFQPGANEFCEFDALAFKNSWRYTSLDSSSNPLGSGFFEQGILKQESHSCDRDYMHVRNMRSCSPPPFRTWWKPITPSNAGIVNPDLNVQGSYLLQNSLVRPYKRVRRGGNSTQADIKVQVSELFCFKSTPSFLTLSPTN